MPHEVFISYSSKDETTAARVRAAVESAGIACWMAPRDIRPGTEWLHAIMEAINASRVLVLIVSAHAIDSPQVQRELVCAVNQRLPILPFRIETVTFTPAFEYLLCVPQWLDAVTPPLQQHLPRLVEAVRQLLPARSDLAAGPPAAVRESRSHNLPVPATPLLGRERELEELQAWLTQPEIHLVTLTGTGGTGKTRLSLEVATGLLDRFAHGVYIVFLADIRDPELVVSEIARTLEVREEGGRRLLESLKEYLRDREMLLVLDNFEQVMAAAPRVAELLAACPRLKILISSREPLHVRGEREFQVPPLALPPNHQPSTLMQSPAVALFVQRAAAIKPEFALTDENAPAIAEICVRLDGLPLAIELAAARIKLLPPAAMLSRLESRLKLLTAGARDLPERQRTLRGAIDWSYDLLDEGEKMLFQRLAVFVGGFTLEAAEAVCNAAGDLTVDVLDGVESLLNKSLLRQGMEEQAEDEPRFQMLATIREYGLERLAESGDEAAIQEQHARLFLALAESADQFSEFFEFFEAAESGAPAAQAAMWLDRLEREHDNFRAALAWFRTSGVQAFGRSGVPDRQEQPDVDSAGPERLNARTPERPSPAEMGLRLAGALGWFWGHRGYWAEGRAHLTALLAHEAAAPAAHAKALHAAGWLAWRQGEYTAAQTLAEEALALRREWGDSRSVTQSLEFLGLIARTRGDYEVARMGYEESLSLHREQGRLRGIASSLYDLCLVAKWKGDEEAAHSLGTQSLEVWRKLGDKGGIAAALDQLADLAWRRGDAAAAQALFEESLGLRQELGHAHGIALSFFALGEIARLQGNYPVAQERFEECLKRWRAVNDGHHLAMARIELAKVMRDQGDYAAARAHLAESLALRRELGDRHGLVSSLQGLAMIASAAGQWEAAARLFGAAAAQLEALGLPPLPADPDQRAEVQRYLTAAGAGLGEAAFETARAAGQVMSLDQVVTAALTAP